MSETLEAFKQMIAQCSAEENRALRKHLSTVVPHSLESEWGVDADTILSAIARSSDLTRRGVRGIIAEAVFETSVLPGLVASGWNSEGMPNDQTYDVLLGKHGKSARVQIKLQRLEKGIPKLYYPRHYDQGVLYAVEVQKTRTGQKPTKQRLSGTETSVDTSNSVTVETRPYRFGDFDILAVNMHPSSGDWRSFRYTVASWLLPRAHDEALIEVFQPVAAVPDDIWTDDLSTCLGWFLSGQKRSVLREVLHRSKARR